LRDGKRREELGDLGGAHLGGMALTVEDDVAPDPADVRLLGAAAVVARLEGVADAIEQPRRRAGLTTERAGRVVEEKTGELNREADGESCATDRRAPLGVFAWRPTITRPA
jgi:hypothetical protein